MLKIRLGLGLHSGFVARDRCRLVCVASIEHASSFSLMMGSSTWSVPHAKPGCKRDIFPPEWIA